MKIKIPWSLILESVVNFFCLFLSTFYEDRSKAPENVRRFFECSLREVTVKIN